MTSTCDPMPGNTDMKNGILAAVLLVACLGICSHAFAFNVGPYRIGMTNAEAAKIGLDRCVGNAKWASCTPTGLSQVAGKSAISSVAFSNKRVDEISTSFPISHTTERMSLGDFSDVLKELHIGECRGIGHNFVEGPAPRHPTKRTWKAYCIMSAGLYRETELSANWNGGGGWVKILIKRDLSKVQYIEYLAKVRKQKEDLTQSSRAFQLGK